MSITITNSSGFSDCTYKFEKIYITVENKEKYCIFSDNERLFIIDGYIVPRLQYDKKYHGMSQIDILISAYDEYGEEYLSVLKGVFNIIIVDGDSFKISNDINGYKKYFIYQDGHFYIISNDLQVLTSNTECSISNENIALFVLFNHFIAGRTVFNEITFSGPATTVYYSDRLMQSVYWEPEKIFKNSKPNLQAEEICQVWKKMIRGYIEYLKPKKVSLTLTGGNDSRLVLAGLLSNGTFPDVFTYGDSESADGVVAKKVATSVNLNYRIFEYKDITVKWFTDLAEEILKLGNSLINIHRAHRLDAVKRHSIETKSEMLFTGLVGGEYIKEPRYDDITLPKIFKSFNELHDSDKKIRLISDILSSKGVKIKNIKLPVVVDIIDQFIRVPKKLNDKQKKFILTFKYYATIHHSQDPVIFSAGFKNVVHPFTDVDFMELLTSSNSWYVYRSRSVFEKVFHSLLIVQMIDFLFPSLSEIVYAKNGEYTGKELLKSKLMFVIKRVYRKFSKKRIKYKQNFPVSEWMYNYLASEIQNLHTHLDNIVDKSYLDAKLVEIRNSKTEEKWYPVSSFVNLSLVLKTYGKV